MVRLFIGTTAATSSLYREIPIPVNPLMSATPTPTPVLPMLEFDLILNLKLASGYKLFASTQNSETFTVIAEGLNWTYPNPAPTSCCSFQIETASTGVGRISTANASRDGSGVVTIFTAPALPSLGTLIKSITLTALQSTHEGMVRLFMSPNGGTNFYLWTEILIPESTQGNFEPSYKQDFEENFFLQAGYVIGATTQVADAFALTIEGESWQY